MSLLATTITAIINCFDLSNITLLYLQRILFYICADLQINDRIINPGTVVV